MHSVKIFFFKTKNFIVLLILLIIQFTDKSVKYFRYNTFPITNKFIKLSMIGQVSNYYVVHTFVISKLNCNHLIEKKKKETNND